MNDRPSFHPATLSLAAGERTDGLLRLFTRKEDAPQQTSDMRRSLARTRFPHVIERGHRLVVQELVVILGEVAGAYLVPEAHRTPVGL
ncbi:MAG: hypothetical protein M3O36_00510 [Myxococcota bacterium]|nr:hypothetical protein [Myxococcota bacterium]